MAKTKISEYDSTANNNTDVASVNIDEGCAPSGINNAIRAVMAHLKDFQQGTNGDSFNGPVNGAIGATTPAAGTFTTLATTGNTTLGNDSGDVITINGSTAFGAGAGITGNLTLSSGTANGVAYLNGSKVLTTGSALTFNGSNLGVTGNVTQTSGNFFTDTTSGYFFAGSGAFTGGIYGSNSGNYANIKAPTDIVSIIGSAEQMRLTSTGLGIGTSSISNKLEVAGTDGSTTALVKDAASGNQQLRLATDSVLVARSSGSNGGLTLGTISQTWGASGGFVKINTNGSTVATFDQSGNLGLGVTPSAWVSRYKIFQSGNQAALAADNTYNATSIGTNWYEGSGGDTYIGTGRALRYALQGNTGAHAWFTAPSGTAGNAISFTQAMTLDASGNLAVGNTSAARRIEISGASSGETYQMRIGAGSSNSSYTYDIGRSTVDGYLYFYGNQSGANGYIFSGANGERARIDSSGNLLVGKTTYGATGGVTVDPNVSGLGFGRIYMNSGYGAAANSITFDYNGTGVGFIQQSTTGVSYNTSSDYRLKNVIGKVSGSGERIDALEPVEYEWKSDGSRARGFLAHKFQEVYAGSVTGSKDAVDEEGKPVYQAMQAGSSEVIADLVAEIQSLRKRLAAAGIA